jgi:hypothetical protein
MKIIINLRFHPISTMKPHSPNFGKMPPSAPVSLSVFAQFPLAIALIGIAAFVPALQAQSDFQARPLAGEVAVFGGKPEQWAGEWVVHEKSPDSLTVSVEDGGTLRIGVTATGGEELEKPTEPMSLSRALQVSEWHADSDTRFSFDLWLENPAAFLYRRAMVGMITSDRPEQALSSRSGWNLICYGASTSVGGDVTLQAGEIALRVRPTPGGEIQTLPTGVFLSSGDKVRVAITSGAGGESFGIHLSGGGNEFSREGLGYWAEKPFGGAGYLSVFFTAIAGKPYAVNLSGLELQKSP